MPSKGEIWLVDFNPRKRINEIGKVRPAIIVQSDLLNHNDGYPNIVIMPMTTQLIEEAEPLRMRITKREKLKKDSDLLIAHIRAVDKSRLIERLGALNGSEFQKVRKLLDEILE